MRKISNLRRPDMPSFDGGAYTAAAAFPGTHDSTQDKVEKTIDRLQELIRKLDNMPTIKLRNGR